VFENGFEFSHRPNPLASRELVNLGRDYRRVFDDRLEPLPRRPIADEARVPRVDEQQGAHLSVGGRPSEVRFRQRPELGRGRLTTAGVAIPGQIDEQTRRPVSDRDAVQIDQPRLARSGACPREPLTHQCVDQARLADVGASDQRHLGNPAFRDG